MNGLSSCNPIETSFLLENSTTTFRSNYLSAANLTCNSNLKGTSAADLVCDQECKGACQESGFCQGAGFVLPVMCPTCIAIGRVTKRFGGRMLQAGP